MGMTSTSVSWLGAKWSRYWNMSGILQLSLMSAITWPMGPRVVKFTCSSTRPGRFCSLEAIKTVISPQSMRSRTRCISPPPRSGVTNRSRLGFGPEPNRLDGFYHTKTWTIEIGRVLPPQPGISTTPLWIKLSISVVIVLWHDQYIDYAVLRALSPPAFRYAIRLIFAESPSKTPRFRVHIALLSPPLNKY